MGAWLYTRTPAMRYREKKAFSQEKLLAIIDSVPQMQRENMIAPEDAFLDYQDGKFS